MKKPFIAVIAFLLLCGTAVLIWHFLQTGLPADSAGTSLESLISPADWQEAVEKYSPPLATEAEVTFPSVNKWDASPLVWSNGTVLIWKQQKEFHYSNGRRSGIEEHVVRMYAHKVCFERMRPLLSWGKDGLEFKRDDDWEPKIVSDLSSPVCLAMELACDTKLDEVAGEPDIYEEQIYPLLKNTFEESCCFDSEWDTPLELHDGWVQQGDPFGGVCNIIPEHIDIGTKWDPKLTWSQSRHCVVRREIVWARRFSNISVTYCQCTICVAK